MSHPTCDWKKVFPVLAAADLASQAVMDQARYLDLTPGQPLFHSGAPCQNYLMLLEGNIRVQVISAGGREALLYRVLPGQSCILTTCCMLSSDPSPAEGFAEGQGRALVVSKAEFDLGMDTAPGFRHFVFESLGRRLTAVIRRMEELTFRPVEYRLVDYLLDQAQRGKSIARTHQVIAAELGTAREVISRHLKHLADQGLVNLGRSSIRILNRNGLESLAREEP